MVKEVNKFQNFREQKSNLKSGPSKYDTGKISRLNIETFWSKMPKFGYLGSNFSKINVKFEFGTFELGYMQNFVKVRKSLLFGPKCPNLGILAQNLHNESLYEIIYFPNFEISGRFGLFCIFWGRTGWFWVVSARFA